MSTSWGRGPDDRATVWIDLDQDGVFETEGENGNEWINLGYGCYRGGIDEGYYLYAVSHREGGGSRVDPRWRTISGLAS